MSNAIYTAPLVTMKNLNHIFIELTAANCNLRCKHCYLEFNPYKKVKDFIAVDKIKKALSETKSEDLKCIYLTGGEPLLHPHFNNILRMCLKRCNVTIFTNGILINDKKARFLRKVEDETNNELIIKLSLDDYREKENDELRGRGTFRKVVFAVQSLVKYEFNPILSIVNYRQENEKFLIQKFKETFFNAGVEFDDINFAIVPLFNKRTVCSDKNSETTTTTTTTDKLDCATSRTLSVNGIYSCPLLTNDERGRCGSSFTDFSKRHYIETDICQHCSQNGKNLFVNSWF